MHQKWIYVLALCCLFGAGIFFRIQAPGADAPLNLSFSQSENTDWPWYIHTALANVGASPTDPLMPKKFNRPLFTSYSIAFFSILEPTWKNLTYHGLLPGLLFIVLMALMIKKTNSDPLDTLFIVGATSFNYILIMYGRFPNIYMWVSLFGIAPIFLWTINGKTKRRSIILKILALTLPIIGFFTLKSMCLFFLVALIFMGHREILTLFQVKKSNRVLFYTITLLALGVTYYFFSNGYMHHVIKGSIVDYATQFNSWQNIKLEFYRYWQHQNYYLFSRMPIISVLAFATSLIIIWNWVRNKVRPHQADLYFLFIFIVGQIIIWFFSYRPIRFSLFLLPSFFYLATRFFFILKNPSSFLKMEFISLKFKYMIQTSIIIFIVIFGSLSWLSWHQEKTFTWVEAQEDLKEILPDDSVLLGPYSHLLSFNGPWQPKRMLATKHTIKIFDDIITRTSATHFVIDYPASYQTFKQLKTDDVPLFLLDSIFVRGREVLVYRILSSKENEVSIFEEARLKEKADPFDQTKERFQKSRTQHARSSASTRHLLQASMENKGSLSEINDLVNDAIKRNPFHPDPYLSGLHLARKYNKQELYDYYIPKILFLSGNSFKYRNQILSIIE